MLLFVVNADEYFANNEFVDPEGILEVSTIGRIAFSLFAKEHFNIRVKWNYKLQTVIEQSETKSEVQFVGVSRLAPSNRQEVRRAWNCPK